MTLPDNFWQQEQDYTDEVLITLIALYYSMTVYGMQGGADGLPAGTLETLTTIDAAKVQALAAHPGEVMGDILETTRTETERILAQWRESGGDINELQTMLDPVFGPSRAELIASTETTQAFQEGNELLWVSLGALVVGKEWRTQNDERVCPICGPLDGKIIPLTSDEKPPAHPRCRCYTVPAIG